MPLNAISIEGSAGGVLAIYGSLLLEELVSVSGGRAFFPRESTQVNEDLGHSIGYRP